MSIKKTQPDDAPAQDGLDVSSILEQYEESSILPSDNISDDSQTIPQAPVAAPVRQAAPAKRSAAPKAAEEAGTPPDQMNDKLKEDLKMSYEAKGILDITYGGYGFLRQDYAINPDKDIYVSGCAVVMKLKVLHDRQKKANVSTACY